MMNDEANSATVSINGSAGFSTTRAYPDSSKVPGFGPVATPEAVNVNVPRAGPEQSPVMSTFVVTNVSPTTAGTTCA
jgi:hypothetical protein